MELLQKLRKDNLQAMKDKDILKKGVLSLVISAIALAEKEEKRELSIEEEYTFVLKELKQTKDALNETPENRHDLIEENKKKIEILESYLPKQLTEEEIEDIIKNYIIEASIEPIKKNQGLIIKHVLNSYKGSVDGKLVNSVLSRILV